MCFMIYTYSIMLLTHLTESKCNVCFVAFDSDQSGAFKYVQQKKEKNFFSLCGLSEKANVSDDLVTPGGRFITLI